MTSTSLLKSLTLSIAAGVAASFCVAASAQTTFAERTITSKAKRGETIEVNTPTHIAATLDFAAGAVGTLITSVMLVSAFMTMFRLLDMSEPSASIVAESTLE